MGEWLKPMPRFTNTASDIYEYPLTKGDIGVATKWKRKYGDKIETHPQMTL